MDTLTQRERVLQAIAAFRLFDDTFMSAAFDGQIPETELLLRAVLERDDVIVLSSEAQFYITNIYGRRPRTNVPDYG